MANVRSGTTWFVDSTGSLAASQDQFYVSQIIISGSHASSIGNIVLKDISPSANIKFTLYVPAGQTYVLDFSKDPQAFYGGINVSTLSNVVATIVVKGG